jgi:hypothetical protein
MSITPEMAAAAVLPRRFNALVDADANIREFSASGTSFERRRIENRPEVQARDAPRGFASILVVRDRGGQERLRCSHAGRPLLAIEPAPTDGEGSMARNTWAAQDLSRRFAAEGE